MSKEIGDVILDLQNISLRFGGVKALSDISFDVREHEIRAIIGPNGAGKSSMLNVINGVYHPQEGRIMFRGEERTQMDPHLAARHGISRTFQNIALFKGMSVLDNIMTGRNLKMKSNLLLQAIWWGPARNEELEHRAKVEEIIDFLEIQHIRKTPVGRLPYGFQKRVDLGRALAMENDRAFLGVVDPVDHVQHRTLAGAVGTDDGPDFMLADIEGNVAERLDAPEAQRNVLQVENDVADLLAHLRPPFSRPGRS